MRDVLNIMNARGVLLLGGFRNGGMERLNAIRERLQSLGYMAMIFDFNRPDSLSLTETVVTMAGLSKFVIADLSGASVPHATARPHNAASGQREVRGTKAYPVSQSR
jgi:hypothetical protein